jgi:hypothetical protein
MRRPLVAAAAAWVALCLVLALVASRTQPTQSPDENQHIARAWLLAQGHWELQAPAGLMSGGEIDANFHVWIFGMLRGWAGELELRSTPEWIAQLRQMRWRDDDRRAFIQIPGTGYYLPVVYAPQAIGLKVGHALGWTIEGSYRLARLLAQMTTAALLVAACLIARPWRPPALALGMLMLPMSLFQFAAPTIDGITTGLALVALALAWRHTVSGERMGAGAAVALALTLGLLVTTRLHALPMLALPMLLAWRCRQPALALMAVGLLAATAAWTAWAGAHTVDTRIVREISSGAIARHYLLAPWEFVAVLGRTLAADPWREFMGHSFVGILGWLDTPMPAQAYETLGLGMLALAAAPLAAAPFVMARGPVLALRLACLGMALVSALIVFAALLATWTPHPAQIIHGMQGRYMLLPALLACCALLPAMPGPGGLLALRTLPAREALAALGTPAIRGALVQWLALAGFGALALVLLLDVLSTRYGT